MIRNKGREGRKEGEEGESCSKEPGEVTEGWRGEGGVQEGRMEGVGVVRMLPG